MAKRQAFTLIELLVVITIIAILAFVAISSYGVAGQRARLDVGVDTLVTVLRQQQGLVKSGKVGTENELRCYGLVFETEDPYVQYVDAEYVSVDQNRADYCKVSDAEFRDYPELGNLLLLEIDKDGKSASEMVVMFKPPFGNLVFGRLNDVNAPSSQDREIKIGIGLESGGDPGYLMINLASGLIERIYE